MKKELIWAAVVVVIFLFGAWYFMKDESPSLEDQGVGTETNTGAMSSTTPAATGLKIEDTVVGTGAEAVAGKMVTVHYTGTLIDGTKFDSSLDRGTPFTFQLGGGQVIEGWDKGFAGMKVGGKRKLTIAPELAYGAGGIPGAIPPNATLTFEVELLGVK